MDGGWGWIRDYDRAGINWNAVRDAGYGGILLRTNEKNLARAIAEARAAGLQVGLWDVPRGRGPEEFARYLASFNSFNPDIVVPDIEFEGKGYPGSEGWDYSGRFTNVYRNLSPEQRLAVTMMPMQDDYDYGSWTRAGAEIWPQAYGGGASGWEHKFDPEGVYQRLIANGVDPDMIAPVLAPGQSYGGRYSMYTLDDEYGAGGGKINPYGGSNAYRPPVRQPGDKPVAASGPFGPIELGEDISLSGDNKKLPDKHNPLAVKYANKRLAQALASGLIKSIPKGDPTAAWRSVSQGVRPAAKEKFMSPEDFHRDYRPKNDLPFY
jgi:hypothetical protein